MEITYYGGSSFTLKGQSGSVTMNPTQDIQSNITTLTNDPEYSKNTQIDSKFIFRPGEYEIENILVKGLQTRLDDPKQGPRNITYTISIDGVNICHLGSLNRPLTANELTNIGEVHVLMLPVGAVEGSLTAGDAAKIIGSLSATFVLPMAYDPTGILKTDSTLNDKPVITATVPSLKTFMSDIGLSTITAQAKLIVTPTNQPASTQIVILDPIS
jgi:hypothetical protein